MDKKQRAKELLENSLTKIALRYIENMPKLKTQIIEIMLNFEKSKDKEIHLFI